MPCLHMHCFVHCFYCIINGYLCWHRSSQFFTFEKKIVLQITIMWCDQHINKNKNIFHTEHFYNCCLWANSILIFSILALCHTCHPILAMVPHKIWQEDRCVHWDYSKYCVHKPSANYTNWPTVAASDLSYTVIYVFVPVTDGLYFLCSLWYRSWSLSSLCPAILLWRTSCPLPLESVLQRLFSCHGKYLTIVQNCVHFQIWWTLLMECVFPYAQVHASWRRGWF